MDSLRGWYESASPKQRQAAQRLRGSLEQEVADHEHRALEQAIADAAVQADRARLALYAREEGERAAHIAKARIALGELRRRFGAGVPSSWLAALADIASALDAMAKQGEPAEVKPLRPPRGGFRLITSE